MNALRWALGTAGLMLMGTGGWLLATETREGTVPQVLLWLAGAVVVHDGLLVPLVLLAGAALRYAYGRGKRGASTARGGPGMPGALRGGLLVGGCLTLIALPMLHRRGESSNPSLLPLDYAANIRLLLVLTCAVTLTLLVVTSPAFHARLRAARRAPGTALKRAARAARRRRTQR